jgi:uncharacterized membrane protein
MSGGELPRALLAYGAALVVQVLLDLVWLRYAGNAFFRPAVGEILTDKPNLVAAGLFYVFFAAGLVFFAVLPGMRAASLFTAIVNGAFLGFLAYMTFDLTNLAILKLWSVKVSVIDISWGTFASAAAAAAGFAAGTVRF